MRHVNELAELLVKRLKEVDEDYGKQIVAMAISAHLDDVLQVVKDINKTSLSPTDRFQRIVELENKFGVNKTFLV